MRYYLLSKARISKTWVIDMHDTGLSYQSLAGSLISSFPFPRFLLRSNTLEDDGLVPIHSYKGATLPHFIHSSSGAFTLNASGGASALAT